MATRLINPQTTLGRRLTRATSAAAAIVLTIGLSACGGSSDSTAESSPEPAETTSSPTPEETEEETTEEETTPEETEEETTEEPTEEKTHELIAGATLLEDAVAELRSLKQSELQEIIDNGDVEKLAYYKSILLLDAAEFKADSIGSGDCWVRESSNGNPLFTDLREMRPEALFCATIFSEHISLGQNKEYGVHLEEEAPLDRDMAIKSEMIHKGIMAKSDFNYRDILDDRRQMINENDETLTVGIKADGESTSIVKESKYKWNDVLYDSINVSFKDNEGVEHRRTFILVPLPKILDFPGEPTTSELYDEDYGHLKIDENGVAVTKDTGTPVVIPILVDRG